MKKYYLHNGTESSGPFDFEELKSMKIAQKTPVWFEGMEKWKIASDIAELAALFLVQPPPIATPIYNPKTEYNSHKTESNRPSNAIKESFGFAKYRVYIVVGVVILAITTIVFNTLDENKHQELKEKNYKTEVENQNIEKQKKEVEEQKNLIAEAEQRAAIRLIEDQKRAKSDRLIEIEKLISISESNHDEAKVKLKNAGDFKLLRTSAEKKEQLRQFQKTIDSIAIEIDGLKIESNKLKFDLEKSN